MGYSDMINSIITTQATKVNHRRGLYNANNRMASQIIQNGTLGSYLKRTGQKSVEIGKTGNTISGYTLCKVWAVVQNVDPSDLIQIPNQALDIVSDRLLILCLTNNLQEGWLAMGVGDVVKFNDKIYEVDMTELAAVGEFYQISCKRLLAGIKLAPADEEIIGDQFINFVE